MRNFFLALMPLLLMNISFAQDLAPELVALVGRHRLIRGDKNCPSVTLVERVRSKPTLILRNPTLAIRNNEFLSFDGINAGRVTYDQGYRSYKQRMTVYERHSLKKLQRLCIGVFVINCREWKPVAGIELLSSQSFELKSGGLACLYQTI